MLFLPDLPARRRWITSPLQLNEKIMHFFAEGRGARLPTARRLPDGLGTIAAVTVSARQQRPQVPGDVQIPLVGPHFVQMDHFCEPFHVAELPVRAVNL